MNKGAAPPPHLLVLLGTPRNILTCPQHFSLPRCQDLPNQLCQLGIPVTPPATHTHSLPSLQWLQGGLGPALRAVSRWAEGQLKWENRTSQSLLHHPNSSWPCRSCSSLLLLSSSCPGHGCHRTSFWGWHFLLDPQSPKPAPPNVHPARCAPCVSFFLSFILSFLHPFIYSFIGQLLQNRSSQCHPLFQALGKPW